MTGDLKRTMGIGRRTAMQAAVSLFVCLVLAWPVTVKAQSTAASSPSVTQSQASSPKTPTADQIIDRYIEAEGGRAALSKLTSRVMTGTIDVPSMSLSGTVEVREKAPNRSLGTLTINGASFLQGFDGTTGWTDDPQNGLRELSGAELAETRRESDFYHTLDLRKLYLKFTLTGTDKVGDRDVYVVEGVVPEGGAPEKMYFDTQTGLLLRDVTQHHSADGVSEFQQEYADYRDTDGMKLPHTIRQINEGTLVVITVEEYHHNVPLDDAQFAKPAAQ